MNYSLLLHGIDTLYVSYYLTPSHGSLINFDQLSIEKEKLQQSKTRDPKTIKLGSLEFQLLPYGSSSGFPYFMQNEDYEVSFGPYNSPSFYVKFKCIALWQKGAQTLHQAFMTWCDSVGLQAHHTESLSRVDFSFDYSMPTVNFNEDDFLSQSKKDSRYRKNGVIQTIQLGKSDVVLRVYDKVAEINEQSHKTWFFDLWETNEHVWRIEWQIRKPVLKRFGINSFEDLDSNQGNLLRYLACEHDTLHVSSPDTNRSRWPLHPLWADLQTHIAASECAGIHRVIDPSSLTEERLYRIAISIYGYTKGVSALTHKPGQDIDTPRDAINELIPLMKKVHCAATWKMDVQRRIDQLRFER